MKFGDFFKRTQDSTAQSCNSQGPPATYKPAEDSNASLGHIRWSSKLSGQTNYTSAQDADIRFEESQIEVLSEAETSNRILKINDQLSIAISYSSDPKLGFGLMLKIADQDEFGWDWFYFAEGNENVAIKLQEEGRITVQFAEVKGKSEIIKMRFDTDVCLRSSALTMAVLLKFATRSADSRLLIKRGSEFQVPVLHDDQVTLLLSSDNSA